MNLLDVAFCSGTKDVWVLVGRLLGIFKIVIPLLVIIFGMIDLAKSLASQKEDEIKKAQSGLLKKAVVAVVVFLVFALVSFVFNFANSGNKDKDNIWNCVDAIINGDCG